MNREPIDVKGVKPIDTSKLGPVKIDPVGLKPCPARWCKSKRLKFAYSLPAFGHWIECLDCGLKGPCGETKELARDKWNG